MHPPSTAKTDAVKTILVLTVEGVTRDVMSMVNGFHANVDQEQRANFVKQVKQLTI